MAQASERVKKRSQFELGATRIFQQIHLPANQKYFLLTITIAVACGLMAVSYHLLINFISANVIQRAFSFQGTARIIWILGVTTGGGLIAGLLLHYLAPNARGSGIPQVKIAYAMEYGRVPLRGALWKAIISAL